MSIGEKERERVLDQGKSAVPVSSCGQLTVVQHTLSNKLSFNSHFLKTFLFCSIFADLLNAHGDETNSPAILTSV